MSEMAMVLLPSAFVARTNLAWDKELICDSVWISPISNEKRHFDTLYERKGSIQVGSNDYIESLEIGTVKFETMVHGVRHSFVFHDVLYASNIIII